MITPAIETLIEEMQEVKAAHQALEISDVLKIFNIQAMKDLVIEIQKARLQ